MSDLPTISSRTFARGSKALFQEIEQTIEEIEPVFLAFFFSLVPERGRKLQGRFRAFQKIHGRKQTFSDFVLHVIDSHSFEQAFLPSGCRNPKQPGINDLIARMRDANPKKLSPLVGVKPGKVIADEELQEAALHEIHFGRGAAYKRVQNLCCRSCTIKRCSHKPR